MSLIKKSVGFEGNFSNEQNVPDSNVGLFEAWHAFVSHEMEFIISGEGENSRESSRCKENVFSSFFPISVFRLVHRFPVYHRVGRSA